MEALLQEEGFITDSASSASEPIYKQKKNPTHLA
jgi:hypothetical protein